MADMPTGGAGGFASGGAGGVTGAEVSKASGGADNRSDLEGESARTKSSQPAESKPEAPAGAKAPAASDKAVALGAGGSSVAAPAPGTDNGMSNGGGAAKAAGVAAAVPAASVAGQVMVVAMFINYLKGMMMTLAALAANVWSMAFGLLLAGVKGAVGAVMGIGTAVSSVVGGAVSAAAAGVASVTAAITVGAVVVGGIVVGITGTGAVAQRDGAIDCGVTATRALSVVEGSNGSVDEKTLSNAKTIYGVLSAWGMPDENVAGIIGNWDAESGVDPTSVQGYFESPQVMSDEKKTAASDTDNGIGLGQWTFGRNAKLRTYADGFAKDWWTLEMQLGFMISSAEGSDAGIVKGMIAATQGTPGEAAIYFHNKWERSADTPTMAQRRADKATKWMGMFSGWEKNQTLADSILAQAGTSVDGANSTRSQAVRADCLGVGTASLTIKEGGLNLEEATELMALYKTEGETFLQSRYGAGGPGDCGYGKADNCVGFSTYFVNKYTSFQRYASGNGIDTAGSMARAMGKPLTKTPTAYSVASGPGSGSEGHTFVVLGVQGDQAVIGEAACGTDHKGTRARLRPLADLTNGDWEFVDVTDLITAEPAAA